MAGLVSSCGSGPIANARPSAEELARTVLQAVEARNVSALRALALSEQEFRDHVWPDLPAARPERNIPFSYVWGELRQKSDQSLRLTMSRYGGRRFDLARVEYAGTTSRYGSYAVHRDTILVVHGPEGAEHRLRLFGSTFENGRAFKVFSFVVDE